ncbi:MAG: CopG family transcriptional regulator [Candidatus Geothermarchaeales archaeon]
MAMVKYVNISIPKELYEKLTKALEGSGYRSPTEYIIFLIRKNLPDLESKDVEKRLKALGYLP